MRAPPQRGVLQELQVAGAWPERGRPPMFLHCRSVLIKRPGQREALRLVAPPPHPHWAALLQMLRWDREAGGAPAAAEPRERPRERGPVRRGAFSRW